MTRRDARRAGFRRHLAPRLLTAAGAVILAVSARSDAAAPQLVRDINTAPGSFEIDSLTAVGGRVFFWARDPEHGWQVWISDGTEADTIPFCELASATEDFAPVRLTLAGGRLFFTAEDAEYGWELWALYIGAPFLRGDATADNRLNIADAVFVLAYLFVQGTPPSCADAADANDDSRLDTADALSILNYLFLHAGPPPDPFGACGVDPTADDLECAEYGPCAEP
jgi:ELWxxDGT repeat protein